MVAAMNATTAHFSGKTACGLAWFGFFKQRGIAVIEILQLHARDFLADESFDGKNVGCIFGNHDGKGVAAVFRAARAPDAMDVVLGMLRDVVVDDMADVRDVQSARGDVGGDEHLEFTFTKTFQRLLAFLLRAVGMQNGHRMIRALEQTCNAIRAVLCAAENEHGIVIHALEQLDEQVGFL